MIIRTLLFLFAFSVFAVHQIKSQPHKPSGSSTTADSSEMKIIDLRNGTRLLGTIVSESESTVTAELPFGTAIISKVDIEKITVVNPRNMVNGEFWFDDPNRTRLFFAPTARMLKAGEGYVQNIYVFFGGGAVGVTDFLSIGGGMSLFPGADNQLYYLTPKIGFKAGENVDIAGGVLFINPPESGDNVGIYYGVATFGNPGGSVTAGVGYSFQGTDVTNHPIFMVGLEKRLSRRTAVVSENWFVDVSDGYTGLISLGFRFFGEGLAADFGLIHPTEGGLIFPLPYVDFVVNF